MAVYSKYIYDSTVIKALAWDSQDKTLVVAFKTNSVWAYFNVPKKIYNSLISSSSLGSFFNKNIRNNFVSIRLDSIPSVQKMSSNG